MKDAQSSRAHRLSRCAAAGLTAFLLVGCAWGQQSEDTPPIPGFIAGPFLIAPSLTSGYSYESNVFLRSETADPPPAGDQVLTVQPALQLAVPFSNSVFRVADSLHYVDYKNTAQDSGKTSNEAFAELLLVFGSHDKLDLNARHIGGVAQTVAFDPGGEVKFEGNSFRFHTEAAAASREVQGARGYRLALTRNALKFDQTTEVEFFNYRGFDGEGAYLQPLSSNMRLAFGYLGTRYDHFDVSPGADPTAVFRTEEGDAVYAQIEGQLGPRQPFSARLGWQRLAFAGNDAEDFSGIVGSGSLSAIVGGGTTLTVTGRRQPYRSFFEGNNFYVLDQVGLQVVRVFQRGSSVGGTFNFWQNDYREPIPATPTTPVEYRRDRVSWLEAYANLVIVDHVVFRISILKNRKYSTLPGADYDDFVVFGGFVLGWI